MSFSAQKDLFDRPFPSGNSFPSPQTIGQFSIDGRGLLRSDTSQRRYLKIPAQRAFDLNEGYEDMSEEPESKKGNINYILSWLQSDGGRSLHGSEFQGAFVCRRRLLTKLIPSPYESNDGWRMAVIVHKKNFFMCLVDESFQPGPNASGGLWLRACFWGKKFEQFFTADRPDGNPIPDRPCNQMEEFDLVNKLRTQHHLLVYNCEMDAFDYDRNTYVEIKTTEELAVEDERRRRNFAQYKLQKWWIQSKLGGVSGVLIGFRDNDGIVKRFDFMPTASLPERGEMWKENVCYHFLDDFLSWMKGVIGNRADFVSDKMVHIFTCDPSTKEIYYNPSSDVRYRFLPDWYIEG